MKFRKQHLLNQVFRGAQPSSFDRLFSGDFMPPCESHICYIDDDDDDDDDGGGSGDDSGFNDEQMKQINRSMNRAITKRLKSSSFKGDIATAAGEAAAGAITQAMPDLIEKLGSRRADDDDEGKNKNKDGGGFKDSEEYRAMIKRDEARDAEVEKLRNERKDEVKGRERREERDVLSTALRSGGVHESRLRGAMAVLYNEDKVIKRDDDGEICYVSKEEWGDELISVEKGVTEFLKTDEGMSYLPPTKSRGTGNRGGRSRSDKNSRSGEEVTGKDDAAEAVSDWLGEM